MAIENENDAYLTKFPGIGKKTARQIVLDLKGKVQITRETTETLLSMNEENSNSENLVKEALLALEALGYSNEKFLKLKKYSTNQHLILLMKQ